MILVTGGLGFIGSAYIWELNQKGIDQIVIYDRFRSEDKWKNIRNLKFQEIILSDQDLVQVEKNSFEAIIHLGACSSTTESDMDFLYRNNFELSKQLWYQAAGEQIPFIYASSAATYGNGEWGFDDEADISKLTPLNKYGFSKQLFDCWVMEQQAQNLYIQPPRFAGLKFFNVFGPHEYHKHQMASVVYHAYHQIKKTGEVKLFKSYHPDYADGEQRRDFVYVKDVCQLIEKIRLNAKDDFISGLYNVGSGRAHTFLHLVESVFAALALEPKIRFIDMPEEIKDRYQYFTEAKMNRWGDLADDLKGDEYLVRSVADYVKHYLEQDNHYLQSSS